MDSSGAGCIVRSLVVSVLVMMSAICLLVAALSQLEQRRSIVLATWASDHSHRERGIEITMRHGYLNVSRWKYSDVVQALQQRDSRYAEVDFTTSVSYDATVGRYVHWVRIGLRTRIIVAIAVALAAFPLVVLVRGPAIRWQRKKRGLCVNCGYDIRKTPTGTCPECGSSTAH